jgi:glycosyltransferase involved in cell wall biosynthesis
LKKIILFAGSFDYEPNRQAFDDIIKNIVPKLRQKNIPLQIIICGAKQDLPLIKIPEITLTGEVENLAEYMEAADIFINSVLTGSGIQTKNIDALSHGLPVVSTEFAAKGLPSYLQPSMLAVAKDGDWNDFTNCIANSLSNPAKVESKFFEDYYWGNIVDRFLDDIDVKR